MLSIFGGFCGVQSAIIHHIDKIRFAPPTHERVQLLYEAASTGDCDKVAQALKRGNIFKKAIELDYGGECGTTALITAAGRGDVVAAKMLIKLGANPNAQRNEDGVTPLIYAAAFGDVTMIWTLLEAGALPDLADVKGRTPLMHAVHAGHDKAARMIKNPNKDLILVDDQYAKKIKRGMQLAALKTSLEPLTPSESSESPRSHGSKIKKRKRKKEVLKKELSGDESAVHAQRYHYTPEPSGDESACLHQDRYH